MRFFSLAILSCCLLGGAVAGLTAAESTQAPATAEPTISKTELDKAIAAKSVVLIDVCGTESFTKNGHLPGAIDWQAHKKDLASLLPKDKKALIVAYCVSKTCPSYKKGVSAATNLGYSNVVHYAPGLSGWVEDGGKLEK